MSEVSSASAETQVSPERVRESLEEVLAQSGFHPPEPGFLDRTWEMVREWLGDLLSESGLSSDDVLWLLAVPGVILLAFVLWRVVVTRERPKTSAAALAREHVASRVKELFAQAEAAAAEGQTVRALRLYFFALVVGLGERGDLEYRDAWTARELLHRGRPDARVASMLEPELATVEGASFGGRAGEEQDVQRLRGICLELLGGWLE